MTHPLVVAITGASGAVYARRLLQLLLEGGHRVHLVISPAGCQVARHELNVEIDLDSFRLSQLLGPAAAGREDLVRYHRHDDYWSPLASGSALTAGMVICPCSGGTLSGIVHGTSSNLIQRAAQVHLKEHRKLVLVPRETPLSVVQLENMCRAARAGAVVLPASPGWYHGVEGVEDLVDFIVARILDQFGFEHSLIRRWGES